VFALVPRDLEANRVFRTRVTKVASVAASALLAVLLIGPSLAFARDTRQLYVGDPARVSSGDVPYQLHPTLVSPGQLTYFDVLIKNKGTQTLTSATVAMGSLIATSDGNGTTGLALPSGWSIKNIVSVSGIVPTCVTDLPSDAPSSGLITPGSYIGFSCNFGNLARNAAGTIRVFLVAGDTLAHSSDIQVSGKVAENVGGNVGSNTNTFFAYGEGTFFVHGDGIIAGLFTNASVPQAKHVSGQDQTTVDLSNLSTDLYLVSIDEVSGGPACPSTITTCSTTASNIHVNNGQKFTTYFVWTILFPVDASYKLNTKTGFIHFFDDYNATTNPTRYETFYNTSQDSCLTKRSKAPCADFSLVTDGSGNTFLQIIFETLQNGSGKYF
jgi:hypothetical protein